MTLLRRRIAAAAPTLAFVALTVFATESCTLNVAVDSPYALIRESGDAQTAPANTQLAAPFTVLVLDQFGGTLRGVVVTWTITSGGGSLSETSTKTDDSGLSSVTYTTGPAAGTATVEAKVQGIPPLIFTVTIT